MDSADVESDYEITDKRVHKTALTVFFNELKH